MRPRSAPGPPAVRWAARASADRSGRARVSYRARTPGHWRDGGETRGELDWHRIGGFREYGARAILHGLAADRSSGTVTARQYGASPILPPISSPPASAR